MKKIRKAIIPQMLDVRPLGKDGLVDFKKINRMRRVVDISRSGTIANKIKKIAQKENPIKAGCKKNYRPTISANRIILGKAFGLGTSDEPGFSHSSHVFEKKQNPITPNNDSFFAKKIEPEILFAKKSERIDFKLSAQRKTKKRRKKTENFSNKFFLKPAKYLGSLVTSTALVTAAFPMNFGKIVWRAMSWLGKKIISSIWLVMEAIMLPVKVIQLAWNYLKKRITSFSEKRSSRELFLTKLSFQDKRGFFFSFCAACAVFAMIVPTLKFFELGIESKEKILGYSQSAMGELAVAKENILENDFGAASANFETTLAHLDEASSEIKILGGDYAEILRFIPLASKVASARYLLDAGTQITEAGKNLSEAAAYFTNFDATGQNGNINSIGERLGQTRTLFDESSKNIILATDNLAKVNIDDLPENLRPDFIKIKQRLPEIRNIADDFLVYTDIFEDILGFNGPRKYLFLFQNNHEMRATGGFLGSYGIISTLDGRINQLFVDGIYNPDGQLKARVIPPLPIQKMSAVWTMHDANWFPDFPRSAEKIAWFYEKTGGPTVDGVISLTPSVIQEFLEITGPIEMPDYDTVVTAENFVEKTQIEVELEYDKELNQPKKFIADLTPIILDRLLNIRTPEEAIKAVGAIHKSLLEKQILLYSRNFNVQKEISALKWSGEILNAGKDYLMVVNTNINGFKTDGVIREKIDHEAEIKDDGTIIDTVTVMRKHEGGSEEFDGYNKVNADYMRIYVPKGSKLLAVDGQTREINKPVLDYANLGFKRDPSIAQEEDGMKIDEASGTRIYEDANKTVFANWVYVSPGESVEITYSYQLPFKLAFDDFHHPVDSYSSVFQKQSGSSGSELRSVIKYPKNWDAAWKYPDFPEQSGLLELLTKLDSDKVVGVALGRK